MSYILAAWIASFAHATISIIGRLTSKYQISNQWLFNFFWNFFVLLIAVPIGYIQGASIPEGWSNILLAGIFYALGQITFIAAIKRMDVSAMMPLYNLRTVFSAVLGALFLSEFYAGWEYILMGAIVIAGFFVTMDEKYSFRSFIQPGVGIMIIAVASLACLSLFINRAIAQEGYWTATIWMFIVTQIFFLPTMPLFIRDLSKMKLKSTVNIVSMSVLGVVANLAGNKALASNITISSIIISLPVSMMMAFLFSFIAPQLLEKHTLKVYAIRFAAAAVMIGATLKLTL